MSEPIYVLGHAPRELERLQSQSRYFDDITRRAFAAAGLPRGSRVLDIGCGVGDVSRLVAELVGVEGAVVGVDRAPEAIAAARQRVPQEDAARIEFRLGSVDEVTDERPFDALVGRFVLMHQANPALLLRNAARLVRPEGLVVMIESAISACVAGAHSAPHSPTYERVVRVMTQTISAAGADAGMGLRLHQVFERAGLPRPTMWSQARVESGPTAAIYEYMAESLRSMRPSATALGVDFLGIDVDRIEEELRAEVVAAAGTLVSPPIVAAWTTVPA